MKQNMMHACHYVMHRVRARTLAAAAVTLLELDVRFRSSTVAFLLSLILRFSFFLSSIAARAASILYIVHMRRRVGDMICEHNTSTHDAHA